MMVELGLEKRNFVSTSMKFWKKVREEEESGLKTSVQSTSQTTCLSCKQQEGSGGY